MMAHSSDMQKKTRYRRLAKVQYGFFSWGLSVLSRIKPIFRLAIRILTRQRHQVRGHILPVNIELGNPEQIQLSRELLVELISRSTAVAAMDECLCRSVGGCADYPVDLGCLVLGDAVQSLHPGLGHTIGKAEAVTLADRALALGLTPLVIHFKSDALLWSLEHQRMLTICFCCPCHCMMHPVLADKPGHITGLPGISVSRDEHSCIGCGRCAQVCITGALEMKAGVPVLHPDKCLACGRCAMACAHGALTVSDAHGQNLEPIVAEYKSRTAKNSVFGA